MYFTLIIIKILKNKIILKLYQHFNIILNIKTLSKKELLWWLLIYFNLIIKLIKINKNINLFFINNFIVDTFNSFNKISINFNKDFYVFIVNYFVGIIYINYKN